MLAGAVMVRESTFPAIAIAIVLVGVGASPAPAQPPGGDTKDASSTTEQVIISSMPRKRDPLLENLLGKAKSEKLSHTQSEVWTVPGTLVSRLRQRLELLGAKFTHLREDWNHILKRDNAPTSPAHQEILARAKQSPETVAVGVMRAPEAAVAEYA